MSQYDLKSHVDQKHYLSDDEYEQIYDDGIIMDKKLMYKKSFICLEIFDKADFDSLLDFFRAKGQRFIEWPREYFFIFGDALVVDTNNSIESRRRAHLWMADKKNRKSKPLLKFPFLYPFVEAHNVTKHLTTLEVEPSLEFIGSGISSSSLDYSSSDIMKSQFISAVVITGDDHNRLLKGKKSFEKYLNDELMNMMLLWYVLFYISFHVSCISIIYLYYMFF